MLKEFPDVKHLSIEDGKGLPLGRSFGVKLWPTFVFMKDGQVVKQMSRPSVRELRQGLEALAAAASHAG